MRSMRRLVSVGAFAGLGACVPAVTYEAFPPTPEGARAALDGAGADGLTGRVYACRGDGAIVRLVDPVLDEGTLQSGGEVVSLGEVVAILGPRAVSRNATAPILRPSCEPPHVKPYRTCESLGPEADAEDRQFCVDPV